jgi:hypothetical protein
MKLARVEHERLGGPLDVVRITAEIDTAKGRVYRPWIEIPGRFESDLSLSGNCWLILLTLLGALHDEDVEIDEPVDPLLLRGVTAVAETWRAWYGDTRAPQINAQTALREDGEGRKSASFFSGGVDSWFTALRHCDPPDTGAGGLLTSDVLIKNYHTRSLLDAPRRDLAACEKSADALNKTFLPLSTNLMTLTDRVYDRFCPISHGAVLAFFAHFLDQGFCNVLIASTATHGRLVPWGSHPLIDPLFSSSRLQIIHDGALFTRMDKVRYIAQSAAAMDNIRVCHTADYYPEFGPANCSRCGKCVRMMTALNVLGVRPSSFDWNYFDEKDGKIFCVEDDFDVAFALDIIEAAEAAGRSDIADLLKNRVRKSKRFFWLIETVDTLRRHPFILRRRSRLKPLRDQILGALGLRTRV